MLCGSVSDRMVLTSFELSVTDCSALRGRDNHNKAEELRPVWYSFRPSEGL